MLSLVILFLAATGGPVPVESGDALTISHPDPKFRMSVPPGYAVSAVQPPGVAYSYQRVVGDGKAVALTVTILEGVIGREEISEADARAAALKKLPPGASFQLGKGRWGEYDIGVMETRFTMQGVDVFSLVAEIPSTPRAVMISVGGPRSAEAQMRSDLAHALRSFRAPSNWLTPTQRSLAFAAGGSAVLSWVTLLVYGILYAAMYRRDVLRHWGFRVSYLTVTVVLFAVAITTSFWYHASKGGDGPDVSSYVFIGVALACAVKTGELYKKGQELRKAAAAPPPAAPPAAGGP